MREITSPKFGNTYALINHALGVGIKPGDSHRSLILLHAANKPSELQGCIAPGTSLTCFSSEWGVSYSKSALKKVMKVAEQEGILELRSTHAIWTAS